MWTLDHPPAGKALGRPRTTLLPSGTFLPPGALMKMLVCAADTQGCFRLELTVIGFEKGPFVRTAVSWLKRLLNALGSQLWVTAQGPCLPCDEHHQSPVSFFLAKLLELLQEACAWHLPSARALEDADFLVLLKKLVERGRGDLVSSPSS